MNWFTVPSPYPEIKCWGCQHGLWNYVLTFNANRNDWAASVKRGSHHDPIIDLGWHFATRAEAEVAIDEHFKSTLQ
jgi:hypothetical protein